LVKKFEPAACLGRRRYGIFQAFHKECHAGAFRTYGGSPLSMFCAAAHKEGYSGRTHHDKDVDRIASLSGMKWILIKYTIFEHSIEKLLKY
jgi:hypothetical protein